jgi:CheY-like chemotaxis protein
MAEIMVVDDTDDVRDALVEVLRGDGHTITEARNGGEAISILNTRNFDLVITDILMPEQDGTEVIMHLEGLTSRPLVLAISGGTPNMPAYMALHLARLKADATLMKPFRNEELRAKVKQLLTARD